MNADERKCEGMGGKKMFFRPRITSRFRIGTLLLARMAAGRGLWTADCGLPAHPPPYDPSRRPRTRPKASQAILGIKKYPFLPYLTLGSVRFGSIGLTEGWP